MYLKFKRLITATSLVASYLTIAAVPAKPTPITFIQPDGTVLSVTLRGDERSHSYLSNDGYFLVNENDALYYGYADNNGQLLNSGRLAKPESMRSADDVAFLQTVDIDLVNEILARRAADSNRGPKGNSVSAPRTNAPANSSDEENGYKNRYGLFPGTHFPNTGSPKSAVILVEYSDVSFTISDPHDFFDRMLNDENFTDHGATGSAGQFFSDVSMGQFTPQFDVLGPVTLPNNRAYYGGNNWSGNDQHPEQMAIHACQILDDDVDFSQYDCDGDGKIDNVFIFYAGRGEASGGGASTVWPHSWEVSSATNVVYNFDGVRLDHYACSNEMQSSTTPDGIGTFVHEFGHVLGLPDLYATSYTGAFTPGVYDTMNQGSYNNNSHTPPSYSVFERNALGWLTPSEITVGNSYTLEDIKTSNQGWIIPTGKDTEFFLFENRQKTGWDNYIPGHGMLVWHVDFKEGVWNTNKVNDTGSHQYVDIEEADANRSASTRSGDPFPGTSNKTKFTDSTNPNMKTWLGQLLERPIVDIVESDGIITFNCGENVIVYEKPDPVVAEPAVAISPVSSKISWSSSALATRYCVSVKEVNGGYLKDWKLKDVGKNTEVTLTKLTPATEYEYFVYAYNVSECSEPSNTVQFVTMDPTLDYLTVLGLDTADITDNSFTALWTPIDLANDYYLDLYQECLTDKITHKVDFSGGIKDLPEGWSTTTAFTYSQEEYCGEAAPSLRFAFEGDITSCTYSEPIEKISFWYRGVNAGAGNELILSGKKANGGWTTIASYDVTISPVQDNAPSDGFIVEMSEFDEPYYGIRLAYSEAIHRGGCAVDDIMVEAGGKTIEKHEVPQYMNWSTGNVSSASITELQPGTTYSFSIVATDGILMSHRSEELYVTTTGEPNSGINDAVINGEVSKVEYFDMQGRVVINPAKGIYIQKTTFVDNRIEIKKIIR